MEIKTRKHESKGTIQFQEHWITKSIGDVAPLQRGFDLPAKKLKKGEFPVVYSNGILNFHNLFKVKGPGVVTGRSGTIGKITYVEEDYWPHNTSLWVTNFKGNYPKFIYYLYKFVKLKRFASGSGVPTLNRNDVHQHEISIPKSYDEQISITKSLSNLDDLIKKLDGLIEKKKCIKKGAMQELLTEKIRLKGFSKDWDIDIIKNCAKITTGSRNTQDKVKDGLYPFFVRSKKIEYINSYSYDGEAVLTAGDGDIGKVFHYINDKFDFHQRVYCISDFDVCLDGYFFYLYFSEYFRKRVMSMTAKSTVDSIRMVMISHMQIPLPEKNEQKAIGKILFDMNSEIKELETKKEKYVMIKNGMMQKLLTGEIRLV